MKNWWEIEKKFDALSSVFALMTVICGIVYLFVPIQGVDKNIFGALMAGTWFGFWSTLLICSLWVAISYPTKAWGKTLGFTELWLLSGLGGGVVGIIIGGLTSSGLTGILIGLLVGSSLLWVFPFAVLWLLLG